jgi:hypothetical protein
VRHESRLAGTGERIELERCCIAFDAPAGVASSVGHLIHADWAFRAAGEELLNDRIVGGEHVRLAGELHQVGPEEDSHVFRGPHDRLDVVGDDEEGRTHLLLSGHDELIEVGHADWVEA